MSVLSAARCAACHAVVNPKWPACLVCGQGVSERRAMAVRSLKEATPSSDLVSRLLAMPLDHFEREGCPMEITVSWWPDTLWFVPGQHEVDDLVMQGIDRGRVWTARELIDLLTIPGLPAERVTRLAQAKAAFGGTLEP